MKLLSTISVAIAGIAFSATASAGAILFVNNSSGTSESGTTAQITANLKTLHEAVGNTVTVVDKLPADLSAYKQVWDLGFSNNAALTGAQQAEYVSFMSSGGGLFVMGENSSFQQRNQSIFSLIALAGGGTVGFTNCSSTQTVNAPFTGPNAVSTVTFNAPGCFSGKGSGSFITSDSATTGVGIAYGKGALENAKDGALTSILDVNFMQAIYDQPNSQNLTKNLIGFVGDQVDPGDPGVGLVPEPETIALFGLGAMLASLARRRTAKAKQAS